MDDAWMRFQKIIWDGQYILPVMPMRLKRLDDKNCEVRSAYRVHSYEVTDYAEQMTGFDGWMIKTESPTKEGSVYLWKLTKG
jgi:hypothetical protein